jgi:threonyl-tRNA synthetase
MIHRALFGSVERFFGVLTEHYAGHFPPWLAPVQVMAVPIAEAFSSYLHEFVSELRSSGVRAQVDDSDDRMQKKIRNHTMAKVPFILIAGAEDIDAGAVSFRFRDGSQENGIPLATAKQRILDAISQKVQV